MGTHPIFESDFDCLTDTGMPYLKSLQVRKEPPWHTWDRDAQKQGLRDTVYYVNGDNYCGEWENNLRSGLGVQNYKKDKTQYTGDWKNDKKEGEGILSKMIGGNYKGVYSGQWKDDKRDGAGVNFYHDQEGSYYDGNWKDGKRHGQGEFHFQNRAQILKGNWSEGISKCGELFEMTEKSKATNPFKYKIPSIELVDPSEVLAKARSRIQ